MKVLRFEPAPAGVTLQMGSLARRSTLARNELLDAIRYKQAGSTVQMNALRMEAPSIPRRHGLWALTKHDHSECV